MGVKDRVGGLEGDVEGVDEGERVGVELGVREGVEVGEGEGASDGPSDGRVETVGDVDVVGGVVGAAVVGEVVSMRGATSNNDLGGDCWCSLLLLELVDTRSCVCPSSTTVVV